MKSCNCVVSHDFDTDEQIGGNEGNNILEKGIALGILVEVKCVLLGKLGHLEVGHFEAIRFQNFDDFSNMDVHIGLDHAERLLDLQ